MPATIFFTIHPPHFTMAFTIPIHSALKRIILFAALLITLLTCPVAASVLDDNVPKEKAKKPKLKPPT
jgi:hypothetical protein